MSTSRMVDNGAARWVGHGAPSSGAGPLEVLPGVWRWADPDGSDRCGTALATPDGLVLIDPPGLNSEARRMLEGAMGEVRHVVLTSAHLLTLAAPFRGPGVAVWTPGAPLHQHALPGGLAICQLPGESVPAGTAGDAGTAGAVSTGGESDGDAAPEEVALFFASAGDGLLVTGDSLPIVGQTAVYREGEAPPAASYRDLIRSLLAMDAGTLAPGRQAPAAPEVVQSTGYAAHVGTPFHRRRGAPVEGPRFLVPQAARALQEALLAPVVLRQPRPAAGPAGGIDPAPTGTDAPWLADPFACIRCGRATVPAVRTCGGPFISRLCPDCRAVRRTQPPALRVMACAGGCCTRDGARLVLSAIRQGAAAAGLSEEIEVVPVSCLGECGIGPLVGVATAQGEEPAAATGFRVARLPRVQQYAADEDEELDEDSDRVLARFTALVQPGEATELVERLAAGLETHGVASHAEH
ncbi:MAG: hypothetical protein M3442_04290 [Chloroflexota bacterium]|nr:hypothetical protein [Chloroflexota bacterium]